MRRTYLLTLLVAALAVFGAAAAQAGKQAICHFPPGNPANFHTIVVSDNAVDKHVAKHDDLIGSCLENCEIICDDGDFCTQDVEADPDQCICLAEPRPAVDCDDSNPCTADFCDSNLGACAYDTSLPDGDPCDDGDDTTSDDVCTDGVCQGTSAVSCPCEGNLIWGSLLDGSIEVTACFSPPLNVLDGVGLHLANNNGTANAYQLNSGLWVCNDELEASVLETDQEVEVCIQQLEAAAALWGVSCAAPPV